MEKNTCLEQSSQKLAERVTEKLRERNMSIAKLAEEIFYSRPTISKYLNGRYISNPKEVEGKLEAWLTECDLEEAEERARQIGQPEEMYVRNKPEYYQSRDYGMVMAVCKSCQREHGLGLVVGKSGMGKTHTLKKYAQNHKVAYIECDDTMCCKDLVYAIEKALGIPAGAYGTIWSRVNRIREFFNVNQGWLLIIDEADKLLNKYTQKKMELIRGIFDQSQVGVVIAGELKLESDIRSNLVRFANRTDFYYRFRGLSKKEVEDYLKDYTVDSGAMQELTVRATNNQFGCFRLLGRTLDNVIRILRESGQMEITMKVVEQASAMMML